MRQSECTYIFPEREKGLCHIDDWSEITTYDVQVIDKVTGEPVALFNLDPYMFKNMMMTSTAMVCECVINPHKPLFGMLVEAKLIPDMFDEGTIPSYHICPEQIEFLGITEKQLEKLEPLVLVIRDKENGHIVFKDFPVMLWEGKAVNVRRNTILVSSTGQAVSELII